MGVHGSSNVADADAHDVVVIDDDDDDDTPAWSFSIDDECDDGSRKKASISSSTDS